MTNEVSVDILGMFFGKYNTAPGAADPSSDFVIKKEDLNQSSGIFVGRYAYNNASKYNLALVCKVTIDGVPVKEDDGSNIPSKAKHSGVVDAPLFRWPGTAKANERRKHIVVVTPGFHKGILGGSQTWGVSMPETQWFPPKTFTVTLV